MASTPLQRTLSIGRKEVLHLLRDQQTLLMVLFFPLLELVMLGYAIDTNVRRIPSVLLDQARTQESAALVRKFQNSDDFRFLAVVRDEEELVRWLREGRARVGIKIPENYSRQIEAGRTAHVQVLVDGSVSAVAGEAIATANALTLRDSLEKALAGKELLVEAKPRVLFNPDLKSANFFVPGLMVILCQMMAMTLSANAIVREKEKGTLEQLFLTPVRPAELILGKLAPYLVLTFLQFIGIALLARLLFGMPMNGPFWVLLAIALPFFLTMLAWGLWVSTQVDTREAAMQSAMASFMPCVFLSGYIFPLDSMPLPFWIMAQMIPTTWLVDAARGVILRGGGFAELWPNAVVLAGMAVVVLVYTAAIFKKRL